MQYLFLNGRSIRDRSLQHALGEAYRGLLLTGRYPISFLAFDMPADMVDVNVHPTKLEVRFQDGGRLYSQLLGTLRTKFLTTDLTHKLDPDGAESNASDPAAAHDAERAEQLRSELVDWAKGQMSGWPQQPASADAAPVAAHQTEFDVLRVTPSQPLELSPVLMRSPAASAGSAPATSETFQPPVASGPPSAAAEARRVSANAPALQVHNRYLIAESDEGVMVIDQHALHERILYEHFRAKTLAGAVESQTLLVPEPVDLSGPEAAAVLEHQELLAQLGLKVEPFGGDTVLISSYPAMMSFSNPAELLRSLIEILLAGGRAPERRDLLDELLHMMSCKAAIKAGDRLTPEEIDALLEQRHLAQDTHHCPHGRPTALVFTREELDRQFKRI